LTLANDLSAEKFQLIKIWWADPILCARQVFGHWFPRPMPWFHRGVIAIQLRRADFLLNFGEETWPDGQCRWTKKKLAKLARCFTYSLDPTNPNSPRLPIFRIRFGEDRRTPVAIDMVLGQHTAIVIPRGFSKTTVINFCNTYKILYKLTRFTVYISEASTHAEAQLATIARELTSNERLISVFGNLKPDRTDDESWGAKAFETKTGVKVAAKGRGSQIRGMNLFSDRPDNICLDDVEDKESVATEPGREKTLSWFVSDVMEALPRNREGHVNVVGTILHPKALLAILLNDRDFTAIRFGAIDPEGEALWDDKAGLTLEQIEDKKISYVSKGKLYEFGLEIMSEVRDELRSKFKREHIRYETLARSDFIACSIHIDPAISAKANADYTAIAVVGQRQDGRKHVCDFHAQQGMTMSEQAEKYFEMAVKWKITHASCEATAYQAALSQSIRELMFIKAKTMGLAAYFEIKDVWPGGRKTERVEGILQPLLAAGYLTFQQIFPELELMLLGWPDEKLDGPDAVAGAIANLEHFAALSYGGVESLINQVPPRRDPHIAPCPAGSGVVP